MWISINGQDHQLDAPLSITQLLEQLNIKGPVAVELNQQICPKGKHLQTVLKNKDALEIVTLVGGG